MSNRYLDAIGLVRVAAANDGFGIALIGAFALAFHGVRRFTDDVDLLVAAEGGEALNTALSAAGYETLHRSADSASYRASSLIAIDVVYARRPPTRAMLARAAVPPDSEVPIVDVEGMIALKLQAIENDPLRRRRDEADIEALLRQHPTSVSGGLKDLCLTLLARDAKPRTPPREPLVANIPHQRDLRPEPPVRSLAGFAEFLAEIEEIFGPDERPRQPITGGRFLL